MKRGMIGLYEIVELVIGIVVVLILVSLGFMLFRGCTKTELPLAFDDFERLGSGIELIAVFDYDDSLYVPLFSDGSYYFLVYGRDDWGKPSYMCRDAACICIYNVDMPSSVPEKCVKFKGIGSCSDQNGDVPFICNPGSAPIRIDTVLYDVIRISKSNNLISFEAV